MMSVLESLFHYLKSRRRLRDPASPYVHARWTTTGDILGLLARRSDRCDGCLRVAIARYIVPTAVDDS